MFATSSLQMERPALGVSARLATMLCSAPLSSARDSTLSKKFRREGPRMLTSRRRVDPPPLPRDLPALLCQRREGISSAVSLPLDRSPFG